MDLTYVHKIVRLASEDYKATVNVSPQRITIDFFVIIGSDSVWNVINNLTQEAKNMQKVLDPVSKALGARQYSMRLRDAFGWKGDIAFMAQGRFDWKHVNPGYHSDPQHVSKVISDILIRRGWNVERVNVRGNF